jgi:hypothetical protein
MASLSLWKLALFVVPLSLASQLASAALPDGRLHGNMMLPPPIPRISPVDDPVTSRNGTVLPPYSTTYYFDQLIDHNNPSLGTFKQRYWHTYEFYEPGACKNPYTMPDLVFVDLRFLFQAVQSYL